MRFKPELSLEEGAARIKRDGGLLQLEIIRQEDIWPLSCAVFHGTAGVLERLTAVYKCSQKIEQQASQQPVLCLCCPAPVRDPTAPIALLIPVSGAPTVAIAAALCGQCAVKAEETIMPMASAAFLKAWPGLRCVEVTHPEGGRA